MNNQELRESLEADRCSGKITYGQYCAMVKGLECHEAAIEAMRDAERWQAEYWKIHKHYLGCAALLGQAMAYVNDDDLHESAADAMLDAATFSGGKVVKIGKRLEIQFTHPAQATTQTT